MNAEHEDNVEARPKGVWNKALFVKALLVIAAIGGFFYMISPPKEPSYNGKPLSYWLTRHEEVNLRSDTPDDAKFLESKEAMRHIGTNAIPTFLLMLQGKDSAIKLELNNLLERQDFFNFHLPLAEEQYPKAIDGFSCLGDLATNAVPALVKIYSNPPSAYSKESADSVLMGIYPASSVAFPYWVPPTNRAEWFFATGQLKMQSGARSNAILAFSGSINLNPTNVLAYLNRATAKMQLQEFTNALGDIKRSIQLDSSNPAAFYAKGLCQFALKDFKSAEAGFTAAISLETNDFNSYNYRGLARGNLRKLDDAIADFNKAIELGPQEATAYRNRALVEGMQKDYELALADVSKSIHLGGKDALAFTFRGRLETALKEYTSAIPDFDKAIALNPKDPIAYSARGTVRVYMDDFDQASADLEKALQLDPRMVPAYMSRGCLKAKQGGGDEGSLADFERAVQLGGQMPETHGMLGLFQYQFSQWVPALENCRKALDLGATGGTADLRSYIWLIRTQTGEEADANRELEIYLKSLQGAKTNQWDASIARFLSGSLPESNFLSQATTTAKRPSAVRSQVCESLYYAGMKRKLAGDKQGALDFFQQCLNTKDDNNFGYMNACIEMRALKNR